MVEWSPTRDRVGDERMNAGDIERRTMRHVSRRLLPFLFILYILNFLDRTNVSIAALQMRRRS